jgi:hypothetical protein
MKASADWHVSLSNHGRWSFGKLTMPLTATSCVVGRTGVTTKRSNGFAEVEHPFIRSLPVDESRD